MIPTDTMLTHVCTSVLVVERGQLYKKLVTDYCNQKNLPLPNYATVQMKKGYVSSITLEGRSYGSFGEITEVL